MPSGDHLKNNPEAAKKAAKARKGIKHKRTLLRQKFGVKAVSDLADDFLELILEFMNSDDKEDKKFVIQHVLKHVIPIKKESVLDLNANANVQIFTVEPSDAGKRSSNN